MLLKAKEMFLIFFMIILLKYFHDSRIIIEILASAREFFSAKFTQFPLPFIIRFWGKPYQQFNFKSH